MRRNFLSIGGMPEKVPPMNFDSVFRLMAERILKSFCETIINTYPEGNYPIAEFQTEDSTGVQIALESDLFTTELLILRKNVNGYELLVLAEGECDGVFEYEFPDNDPLCGNIEQSIRQELQMAFDQ